MKELSSTTKLKVTYDGVQRCTTLDKSTAKSIVAGAGTSCGGTGNEISPISIVGSSLGSCMLLSMGTVALPDDLDISGATVDVDVSLTKDPVLRLGSIELIFKMPRNYSESDRQKLEGAAAACPIKPSFHPDIHISVNFEYPEE